MSRQVVYTPLGVVTQPNQYGQYPAGAFQASLDVCMRSPGTVTPRPVLEAWNDDPGVNGILQLWSYRTSPVDFITYLTSSSGFGIVTPTTDQAFTVPSWVSSAGVLAGAARSEVVRITDTEAWFSFTTAAEPLVVDNASNEMRSAGCPALQLIFSGGGSSTNASVMATGYQARYIACVKRTSPGGYVIRSAPTNSFVYSNTSGSTVDPSAVAMLQTPEIQEWLAAGDVIELYRTDLQPNGTDPGTTFYLVREYTLTSSDISTSWVAVVDHTPDLAGGAALYTNNGESDNGDNLKPGVCYDVANFKGYTFYAEQALAPYFDLRIQGGYGILSTNADRTNGIGVREFTGTPSGSTITGVSNTRGLVAGQQVRSASVAGTYRTIVSVIGTTITLDGATPAGGTYYAYDVMSVSGTTYRMAEAGRGAFEFFGYGLSGVDTFYTGAPESAIDVVFAVSDDNAFDPSPTVTVMYGFEFILQRPFAHDGNFTLRATNGSHYSPALPEITETAADASVDSRPNRLIWSKLNQPEACPPANEMFVGSGSLYRMVVRRDSILVWCSDGLWMLTGDAGVWRADLVDAQQVLSARSATTQMDGTVFAYTSLGFVAVTEGGTVQNLSAAVVGNLLPGATFSDTWELYMVADEANKDVWLMDSRSATSFCWTFNTNSTSFNAASMCYEARENVSAAVYLAYSRKVLFAQPIDDHNDTIAQFSADTFIDTCALLFQAMTGDDNAFIAKQWSEVTLLFRNVVQSPIRMSMVFLDGVSHSQDSQYDGTDYRIVSGIPLTYGVGPRLVVGFTPDTSESNNASGWELVGVSPRFAVQAEEYMR